MLVAVKECGAKKVEGDDAKSQVAACGVETGGERNANAPARMFYFEFSLWSIRISSVV